jgi:hypothetical protein
MASKMPAAPNITLQIIATQKTIMLLASFDLPIAIDQIISTAGSGQI